eukprot:Colp12_sorted_trinity150504_noHs@1129
MALNGVCTCALIFSTCEILLVWRKILNCMLFKRTKKFPRLKVYIPIAIAIITFNGLRGSNETWLFCTIAAFIAVSATLLLPVMMAASGLRLALYIYKSSQPITEISSSSRARVLASRTPMDGPNLKTGAFSCYEIEDAQRRRAAAWNMVRSLFAVCIAAIAYTAYGIVSITNQLGNRYNFSTNPMPPPETSFQAMWGVFPMTLRAVMQAFLWMIIVRPAGPIDEPLSPMGPISTTQQQDPQPTSTAAAHEGAQQKACGGSPLLLLHPPEFPVTSTTTQPPLSTHEVPPQNLADEKINTTPELSVPPLHTPDPPIRKLNAWHSVEGVCEGGVVVVME